MPKFLIALGLASLLSLGWALRAQEPADEEAVSVPGAEPADPAALEEKDVPRALPVETEIPRAKPVAAEELEVLKRTREEKRRAEDAEILRLKVERIEMENRRARDAAETPPTTGEGDEASRAGTDGNDATDIIPDGAIVTIDGNAGTVTIDSLPS